MEDKVIVPLCGVDESMTGFSINGWEIKKLLSSSGECTIFDNITDSKLFKGIHNWLDMEDSFSIIPFTNDRDNPYYMVFVKETDDAMEIIPIVDVLRLIKTSQFGCWHPIVGKFGHLLPVGKCGSYMTDVMQIRPR